MTTFPHHENLQIFLSAYANGSIQDELAELVRLAEVHKGITIVTYLPGALRVDLKIENRLATLSLSRFREYPSDLEWQYVSQNLPVSIQAKPQRSTSTDVFAFMAGVKTIRAMWMV